MYSHLKSFKPDSDSGSDFESSLRTDVRKKIHKYKDEAFYHKNKNKALDLKIDTIENLNEDLHVEITKFSCKIDQLSLDLNIEQKKNESIIKRFNSEMTAKDDQNETEKQKSAEYTQSLIAQILNLKSESELEKKKINTLETELVKERIATSKASNETEKSFKKSNTLISYLEHEIEQLNSVINSQITTSSLNLS